MRGCTLWAITLDFWIEQASQAMSSYCLLQLIMPYVVSPPGDHLASVWILSCNLGLVPALVHVTSGCFPSGSAHWHIMYQGWVSLNKASLQIFEDSIHLQRLLYTTILYEAFLKSVLMMWMATPSFLDYPPQSWPCFDCKYLTATVSSIESLVISFKFPVIHYSFLRKKRC